MTDQTSDCLACRANRGELSPPGGVIYDDGLWRLEHLLMPAVLPGWLVLLVAGHLPVEDQAGLDVAQRVQRVAVGWVG